MKLNLQIDGTAEEIADFLKAVGNGKASEDVIAKLSASTAIRVAANAYSDSIFAQVGWGTILLCQIVAEGQINESGFHEMPFDVIFGYGDFDDADERKSSRKISSRVGGLRKVTDRTNVDPILLIERIDEERVVTMPSAAKQDLRNFLNYHNEQWEEWLSSNNIDPDTLYSN